MPYNPKFDLELRFGQGTETALYNLPLRATVEVKYDRQAVKTGNLCVEWCQRNSSGQMSPSGINTTKAMYWAFCWEKDSYIILPTERVKQLADLYRKDPNRYRETGDNGNWSVLVPISSVIPMRANRSLEVIT